MATTSKDRIQAFNDTYKKLNSILDGRDVYMPYVHFEIPKTGFVCDTCNVGLNAAGNVDPLISNYIQSVQVEKTGVGQANTITIVLAYVPKPGDDPDMIDKAISYSDRQFKIQYGYNFPKAALSEKLITNLYGGLILDYSFEYQQNIIIYSLKCVSTCAVLVDSKLTIIPKTGFDISNASGTKTVSQNQDTQNTDGTTTSTSTDVTMIQPSQVALQQFQKYLGEGSPYANSSGKPYVITVDADVNDSPVSNLDESCLNIASDITVFQYVDSILAQAVDSTQAQATATVADTEKIRYTYEISQDDSTISIIAIDPTKMEEQVDVVFTLNDQSNSTVIDFKTEFKGSVIAGKLFTDISDKDKKFYGLDDKGDMVDATSNTGTSGATAQSDNATSSTTWAIATQLAYKATLISVGIPCEIPLTALLKVTFLIYGVPHHTSGTYLVTGITDIVDGTGFITTLSLVKIMPPEVKNMASQINIRAGVEANMEVKDNWAYGVLR